MIIDQYTTAAYRALGLLRSIVNTDGIPPFQRERALMIIAEADDAEAREAQEAECAAHSHTER